MIIQFHCKATQAYISHLEKLEVMYQCSQYNSNLSESADDKSLKSCKLETPSKKTTYAMVPMHTCYGCLHTCGKIVCLVNVHKLTLTTLIKLIKHVTLIM